MFGRQICYTEPEYGYGQHPFKGSFYSYQSNHTPKKVHPGTTSSSGNHLFPMIVNRASMVSQTTTNYSSNNKKTYGDTSIEHFESEEK
jgi:hypothetical protein